MFYQIIQYIKFIFKSTNQHGVHSPFMYDLVTKCFYDKKIYPEYKNIANYRNELLKNNNFLEVNDLGPGSRKTKTNKRQIGEIAKTSGTTIKRAKLLYRISKYFKSNTVLELGTSLGTATQAIGLGFPESNITTIEGCPNISFFSKSNFKKQQLNNIEVLTGDFDETIKNLSNKSYDLIFFDGNHQKEATLSYFENLLPKTNNNTVFIFDDIYWSKEMTEAWETIKQHPKVTVSLDTFYWGFVFFRKEQAKEHFTLRV
ncbi:O-methyltransferase [Seonamhaeicola maritimus]|uniref:Class I SAM-dependent methyltransferase n=1 Tax=Seonamhaeicola maritimus TaxID=2591822 RepID=A0A5C7GL42_9FLAO|nr:class I SAM-dependent methyltransferase [Seonamhaeicola maritimus]TXG38847.1 class I SAM-dependent methyltransferase [Seonamhaeicola maritimus]